MKMLVHVSVCYDKELENEKYKSQIAVVRRMENCVQCGAGQQVINRATLFPRMQELLKNFELFLVLSVVFNHFRNA